MIYETGSALLDELHARGCRLRLLGLTLSGLTAEATQLVLDDSSRELARDEAVDRVRAKFGAGALHRAGLGPGALSRPAAAPRRVAWSTDENA